MYSKNPEIIETHLEGELILLDPGTGEMFSLNETGRRIWSALPADSVATVARELHAALEVELTVAERDVRDLFNQLHAAGLIRTSDSEGSAG
jgi:hypothetical protein